MSFIRFDALPSPRPKRNPIRGKGCSNPLSASARFSQPPAELTQIPSRRLSLAWPCCFMLLSVACRRHFSENVKLRLGVPSRQVTNHRRRRHGRTRCPWVLHRGSRISFLYASPATEMYFAFSFQSIVLRVENATSGFKSCCAPYAHVFCR